MEGKCYLFLYDWFIVVMSPQGWRPTRSQITKRNLISSLFSLDPSRVSFCSFDSTIFRFTWVSFNWFSLDLTSGGSTVLDTFTSEQIDLVVGTLLLLRVYTGYWSGSSPLTTHRLVCKFGSGKRKRGFEHEKIRCNSTRLSQPCHCLSFNRIYLHFYLEPDK